MTLPTPTPLTDAEIAELISAASSPESAGCGEFDLRIVGAKGRATRRLVATITSLQSDLAAAEERATYYAANARGMDGPSDGSIYSAVSAIDAINGERAATARAEAAESDLARTRDALSYLVGAPLRYNGACIEIHCHSHSDAMEAIRKARATLATPPTGT